MSKLSIVDFEDRLLVPNILSPLVDEFNKITSELPTAIIVTIDQWDKFFFAGGERLTNFRGIPLETPDLGNDRILVVKTINSVLSGMHNAATRDVAEVYRLLENMKIKISGDKNV